MRKYITVIEEEDEIKFAIEENKEDSLTLLRWLLLFMLSNGYEYSELNKALDDAMDASFWKTE